MLYVGMVFKDHSPKRVWDDNYVSDGARVHVVSFVRVEPDGSKGKFVSLVVIPSYLGTTTAKPQELLEDIAVQMGLDERVIEPWTGVYTHMAAYDPIKLK